MRGLVTYVDISKIWTNFLHLPQEYDFGQFYAIDKPLSFQGYATTLTHGPQANFD